MIPPDTLARVKERTDIVALIGETVRLTRRGRSFLGLCPFHKEKSPSFHVHPERGFYHCFGCSESGSAIDFVMKQNGLEFIEAVRFLAERAGVPIEEVRSNERSAQKSERDELFAVMQLAATFYERCLGFGDGSPKPHALAHHAIRELEKRGMPPLTEQSETAERWRQVAHAFRIGYAPASWDALSGFFKQQGISPLLGERAGLLVPGKRGHYDRFRHRLMFAVLDVMGRVIAFSGRSLAAPSNAELASIGMPPPAADQEAPAKYINSPESPIYKKGEQLFGLFAAKAGIRQKGHSLLVEGNFDVVALHAAGFDNAVAPLGTAFTSEQAKLLKRFSQQVIITFDGDAAGRKATRAARVPCREGGLEARVVRMPNGLDPDELIRTRGPDALGALIKGSQGLLEHLVQEALDGDRFDGASLTERVARVRAVTTLLSDEPDPNLRMMGKRFADQLSTKLIVANVPAQDLSQLERLVATAMSRPEPTSAPRERITPEQTQALAIFGAILDFPDLLLDPEVAESLATLSGDVALSIISVREHLVGRSESAANVADFLATLPRSIQSFAAGRVASPRFDDISAAKTELTENSQKLRNLAFGRQKVAAIDALSKSSSPDEEMALLRQLSQNARRKKGLDD